MAHNFEDLVSIEFNYNEDSGECLIVEAFSISENRIIVGEELRAAVAANKAEFDELQARYIAYYYTIAI